MHTCPFRAGLSIISVVNTFNRGDFAFDPIGTDLTRRTRRSTPWRSRSRARLAWQVDRPTPRSRGPSSVDTSKAAIWLSLPR